jgi:hypothetical protein
MPGGSTGGIPNQGPWNTTQGEIHAHAISSNFRIELMMQQQTQFPFVGQGHSFYQKPSQQSKFSWQPRASQNPGPSFHVNTL